MLALKNLSLMNNMTPGAFQTTLSPYVRRTHNNLHAELHTHNSFPVE